MRVFGIPKELSALLHQPYGSVFELHPGTDKPLRVQEFDPEKRLGDAMMSCSVAD